jgi:hypothetical protein
VLKVVSHGRYVTFQLAEVAVSRQMFADILSLVRPAAGIACASMSGQREQSRRGAGRVVRLGVTVPSPAASIARCRCWARFAVA